MYKYDYLVVGAGLYGAVFAWRATQAGKRVLVIDKRPHTAGNTFCERIHGIDVHKYGAHIFHTSDPEVWQFVNRFAEFNGFINSPIARHGDKLYNLPFNMNTFHAMWGVCTPEQARRRIDEQRRAAGIDVPRNLEEQAISLVGRDIYDCLIKGYTEKQWGCDATQLPAFIIRRLPVRFTFDNNYFSDRWQGIPVGGYNVITDRLLEGIEVRCNTDFFARRAQFEQECRHTVFTGRIDEYYGFRFGALGYRSLRFESELLQTDNYQGNAVVNYTERDVPWTRIIEHKHFAFGKQPVTVITREYPARFEEGLEPYYPINDERNDALYRRYRTLADSDRRVTFGGRLGEYRYYDMDKVIASALKAEIL